jgi:hypothetical protein
MQSAYLITCGAPAEAAELLESLEEPQAAITPVQLTAANAVKRERGMRRMFRQSRSTPLAAQFILSGSCTQPTPA